MQDCCKLFENNNRILTCFAKNIQFLTHTDKESSKTKACIGSLIFILLQVVSCFLLFDVDQSVSILSPDGQAVKDPQILERESRCAGRGQDVRRGCGSVPRG